MLGILLIVLVIGQQPSDPSTLAFGRAVRGVLGPTTHVQIQSLAEDPPDEESAARGANADGVVELVWAADGSRARVHCYLSHEARWVDREITFGASTASPEREAAERGRLLGFAVATMFAAEAQPESAQAAPQAEPAPQPPAETRAPASASRAEPVKVVEASTRHEAQSHRSVEFAGVASGGVGGTAAGLGAMAGLRMAWLGPLWGRAFVAGRSGNIPRAQADSRTVLLGAGLAFAALPPTARFELGLRIDGFACYFDATHFSEDDVAPDRRSRWLPGADLLAEGGIRLSGSTGLFLGGGLELLAGKTDVFTQEKLVAVIPAARLVGEFGLRTRF